MSKRVIAFGLDPDEIDKAIKELGRFKRDFITACNELLKQLGALATDTAKSVLVFDSAIFTAQLYDSLGAGSRFDAQTRTAILRTDVPYAAYVEFGTGIVGDGDHPDAGTVGWKYDVNGHGEGGWYYRNDRDGQVHWTQGEPAKPFMYSAFARVRSDAPRLTATIFAKL